MILSPIRKPASTAVGNIMFHRNNLGKFFNKSSSRGLGGDLLSPSGGVVSPEYYQSQHLHLYHGRGTTILGHPFVNSNILPSTSLLLLRKVHCSCLLSNGSDTNSSSSNSTSSKGQRNRTIDVTASEASNLDSETKTKLDDLKEKLAQNAYYEKYKEKFQQLELTSPRELLAKLEQLHSQSRPKTPPTQQKKSKSADSYSQTKTHTLQEVMEVDLLKDLERDDIIYLWQEFHRKKDGLLAAVMSSSVFEKLADLASIHPLFVMPLPRDDGYEFFFVQYTDKAFHFTPLIAYQAHKENAPVCLRLINYTDLQSSKDLVLMRGEYDKNLLKPKDAHIMAVQTNFYYGETSDSRKKLLNTFSSNTDGFHHMELIEELKKLQESHPHLFELDENK